MARGRFGNPPATDPAAVWPGLTGGGRRRRLPGAMAVTDLVALSRTLRDGALNAVLPPRCLACGAAVDSPGTLCPACWEDVEFLGPPLCARCGVPFEVDAGADALCAACAAEPPPYLRARAVMRYDDGSKGLVLAFKHADRTEGAPAFARWLARAGAEVLADADIIVPVPLHRWRLFRRRYNQAAVLAVALARETGTPVDVLAMVRRRLTRSQGRLSREGRRRNVQGAFAVPPAAQARLEGRRVLLVDDVLTTGATAEACARALLRGGAAAVDVLTLAKVVLSG
jgi:ComF family protein